MWDGKHSRIGHLLLEEDESIFMAAVVLEARLLDRMHMPWTEPSLVSLSPVYEACFRAGRVLWRENRYAFKVGFSHRHRFGLTKESMDAKWLVGGWIPMVAVVFRSILLERVE